MRRIFDVFKKHKWRIILVYLICITADTLWAFEPYILGKMLDGIIGRTYNWVYIFICINMIFIIIGYIRRVVDTKVFSRMYNTLVFDFVERHVDKTEPSKMVARIEMSKSLIDFLENVIPHFLTVVYAVGGSLIAIMFINSVSAMIVGLIMVPTIIIMRYFYFKSQKMANVNNSNFELNVSKIESKNVSVIRDYFIRRRRILIMDSTLNAKNVFASDLLSLIFVVISLIYYVSNVHCTVGDATAFYGYINRFVYSLGAIPYFIWNWNQIKNISERLN